MEAGLREAVRQLWAHAAWADRLVMEALNNSPQAESAWTEYAHILGAEETWIARLEGRSPRVPVWPQLDKRGIEALRLDVLAAYDAYLGGLDDAELSAVIDYTNTAGTPFQTRCADILLHVAMHGQYHRGRINVLLRQGGSEPVPVDYIAFVRGAPAARTRPQLVK